MPSRYDSLIIGAGPNGLAAAITLAGSGRSVCVVDRGRAPGGCLLSEEATLPGFVHDTCSAVFPMAVGTPFFSSLPPEKFPVEWIIPPAALAHPFDDGSCVLVTRSMQETMESLGEDGPAYARYVGPFALRWEDLSEEILQPVVHLPRHPLLALNFGLKGVWPASMTAGRLFRTERARAFFAGMGTHSIMPPEHPLTSSFALFMCASAHATGWPMPRAGAGMIAAALASYLKSLGAEVRSSCPVTALEDLPKSTELFFDLAPSQILALAGSRIRAGLSSRLAGYRTGPGAFKVDWALEGPIPWKAQLCRHASTLHLGGSYEEIALSENQVHHGIHPKRPFVLCVQPSLFDNTRAPAGRHTAWAYCHVPNGSEMDMTERIEQQVERFAPGFRKMIMGRRVLTPSGLERLNANLSGGDIAGGANTVMQMIFRPVPSLHPYCLGEGLFICSASSPPGGGVHGMCGYNAARVAIKARG